MPRSWSSTRATYSTGSFASSAGATVRSASYLFFM